MMTTLFDFELSTWGLGLSFPRMAAPENDVKHVAHLAFAPDEETRLSARSGHVIGDIEKAGREIQTIFSTPSSASATHCRVCPSLV
jgi:hypothetical protein